MAGRQLDRRRRRARQAGSASGQRLDEGAAPAPPPPPAPGIAASRSPRGPPSFGRAAEQRARVGVQRVAPSTASAGPSSITAPPYITSTRRQWRAMTREIVADQQHRHARSRALSSASRSRILRLHRDVERGGRLVGDQQLRAAGERHGDHHPLPLAARQREADRRGRAARDRAAARASSSRTASAPGRGPRQAAMQAQRLGDLSADADAAD